MAISPAQEGLASIGVHQIEILSLQPAKLRIIRSSLAPSEIRSPNLMQADEMLVTKCNTLQFVLPRTTHDEIDFTLVNANAWEFKLLKSRSQTLSLGVLLFHPHSRGKNNTKV